MAKSENWYAAMRGRKGTNQHTKALETGIPWIMSDETREKLRKNSTGKRHSEETKKKISEGRIAYLLANPDKVPYKINHYTNGPSYPEQYWSNVLTSRGLDFQTEYRIGLYSLDFAFVDKKIDLEIDGDQHYLDNRIAASDIRRTDFLESSGWSVMRVKWSDFQKLSQEEKIQFIDYTVNKITGA